MESGLVQGSIPRGHKDIQCVWFGVCAEPLSKPLVCQMWHIINKDGYGYRLRNGTVINPRIAVSVESYAKWAVFCQGLNIEAAFVSGVFGA